MKCLMPSRKTQTQAAWFLLIVYLNFMAGCSYFRVKTLNPLSNQSITEQIQKKKKYIILHDGDTVWHLKDIVVDGDGKFIKGAVEILPDNHQYYKTAKPQPHVNRDRSPHHKEADDPIHEIHIYTSGIAKDFNSQVSIPFSTISKVEVYDRHVGATVATVVGSVLSAFVIIVIIVAATKSSCPFVYISNGESYSFTGEMYGGAIYPSLERDDYMPLPGIRLVNSSYQLKIANELLERQYTNLAKLVTVNHPQNTDVIIDKNGNVQTLLNLQPAISAISDKGTNYTQQVAAKDTARYLFQEGKGEDGAVSSLIISFKRPANSKTGKLVINAKNSYWLDYVYGKFNELFGMYYNSFVEDQKKEAAEKLNQWSLDQHIPLSVFVQSKDGWKFVDYFNPVGPLASRDLVVPINFLDAKGDEVKIKLETGFRFWEVDYAAMDFSPNIPVDVTSVVPTSALDENGKNVSDLLAATDDKYLEQPEIGNVVTVTYSSSLPQRGQKQTVFLHSRGYYEYIRDYKNLPDFGYLKSFRMKGAFTKFAREQFNTFVDNQDFFAAVLTQRDED